jgi:hypothetical protein
MLISHSVAQTKKKQKKTEKKQKKTGVNKKYR